jgi:eukaryotic-like serine/threonine-protein kinase
MRPAHLFVPLLLVSAVAAGPAVAQRPAWTFQTEGRIFASPTVNGSTVFVGSSDRHLYAVDAETGVERWRFRAGGAVDATPAVADGRVYAVSRDGALSAVDATDGTHRWTFRTGGEQRHDFWDFYLSDPLVHGGLVVFGSGDGHVYAVEQRTGEERWRYRTGGMVHGSPVADDRHVYVGSFDGVLYALDLATGEPAWTYRVEGHRHFPNGELQRGPALHHGVLYVGSRDYHLYALNAEDGTLRWRIREGDGWIIATPLVDGEHLYFGASDGQRFYAATVRDGAVAWSIPVQTRVFGSAVRAGDAIVFGGFNGKLLAVDPRDGALRWSFQTPASRANFETVYDERGEINEEMRAMYRRGQGRAAEEMILSLGSIAGTPAVDGSRIYFGSTDGVLYALDTGDTVNDAGR